MYNRFVRTNSHGRLGHLNGFQSKFPELNNVSIETLAERFDDLKLDFYTVVQVPTNKYIRWTLPLAVIVALVMFISVPLNFMMYGNWFYTLGSKSLFGKRTYNWFKSLKLV